MSTTPSTAADSASRSTTALGVALVALVTFVIAQFVAADDNDPMGWLWPVAGLLGLVGAILGWRAQQPPKGRALAAVIIGGLLFLMILGWVVVALISGEGL